MRLNHRHINYLSPICFKNTNLGKSFIPLKDRTGVNDFSFVYLTDLIIIITTMDGIHQAHHLNQLQTIITTTFRMVIRDQLVQQIHRMQYWEHRIRQYIIVMGNFTNKIVT